MRFRHAWDHFWLWIDWHGRLTTLALLIIALGGSALANRGAYIWAQVSGVYLWVFTALVFALFLCTLTLAGNFLDERQRMKMTDDGCSEIGNLPRDRPRVFPVEYAKSKERNSYGLFVRNPGYDALEVHIPSVPVQPSAYMLTFPEKLSLLAERDHLRFIEAWLEDQTQSLPGRDGGQLQSVMRAANIELVKFAILYKDTDFRWYETSCVIERTQRSRSGLEVRAIGQRVIPAPY